jgi:threonine dehydratase
VLSSRTLSERAGGTVALKAENLQRTGSFKLRGALAKIAALGERCSAGVVTGSAGNHAQAVAYAARTRGVHCEVFMPEAATIAKVEAATALGATVHLVGASVHDSLEAAHERAGESGLAFVHPFDDPDVIAGQGGVGLELTEQVPDIGRVIVPVGGGGLAAGIAIALRALRPGVRIVGVQAGKTGHGTIADGIAVKHPGDLTMSILNELVDDVVHVEDDAIAEAIVLLLERAKMVVEGAGAASVAALLGGQAGGGNVCALLSGGNIDATLLVSVVRHGLSRAGRFLVLRSRVPDRPGELLKLLELVAAERGNILEIHHFRESVELHVAETGVELTITTRNEQHCRDLIAALEARGYPIESSVTRRSGGS